MLTRGIFWAIMGASGHMPDAGFAARLVNAHTPRYAVFLCMLFSDIVMMDWTGTPSGVPVR